MIDEEAVRALVRDALARRADDAVRLPGMVPGVPLLHASHVRYALPESDGPCLIEPGVACTHCGYCQSHGH